MKIYKRDVTQSYFKNAYFKSGVNSSKNYVPADNKICTNRYNMKPIAFYLPQFYQNATNDKNWGEGYTEWDAVTRSVPIFLNHYQPQLPDQMGFYNLNYQDPFIKQIDIAKKYGIYGFCFYLYNFGDQIELRLPLDNFCNTKGLNFPFCICWANENWTRKWDGKDKEILITQKYCPTALLKIAEDFCKYFKHRNYIKINGKPLFIVYNPKEIPNLSQFAELMRSICAKNCIGDIHLSYVNKEFDFSPEKFGFDSVTEFPPHNMFGIQHKNISKILFTRNFNGKVFDLEDYIQNLVYKDSSYKIFRSAFPAWDNSPRKLLDSHIFYGASPKLFELWLKKIKAFTIKNHPSDERIFFINAWNEWGEGAHLEPDKKYGYAYLQALRNVLDGDN